MPLSPQAKDKIERPYGWVQDHLIRTCIRENVKEINHAQRVLNAELDHYNYKQIHSTTLEIPSRRFNSALEAKKSLFRSWVIPRPFLSLRDIFALRAERSWMAIILLPLKTSPLNSLMSNPVIPSTFAFISLLQTSMNYDSGIKASSIKLNA